MAHRSEGDAEAEPCGPKAQAGSDAPPSQKSKPSPGDQVQGAASLSNEEQPPPPLPDEPAPDLVPDDGWDPVWDECAQAFYFYNRFTHRSQWENPRVPSSAAEPAPPGVDQYDRMKAWTGDGGPEPPPGTAGRKRVGGYDPAIHGDYDPEADYAKAYHQDPDPATTTTAVDPSTFPHETDRPDPSTTTATATFNRFTGRWQLPTLTPSHFNDDNKSRRQLHAYFDVDAAANSHDGRSLKAERSGQKLSKKEVKAFRDKRRERKEEKRRAWLRD